MYLNNKNEKFFDKIVVWLVGCECLVIVFYSILYVVGLLMVGFKKVFFSCLG